MIHSDWGDWLPRAIQRSEPSGLAIWYLGCNGFVLKSADGTTVFIDPYLGTGDPPRTVRMIPVPFAPEDVANADAVLATHEHTDHVHGPSQAPILADTGAPFYGPEASIEEVNAAGWRDSWPIDADQLRTVAPGDRLDIGDMAIHVETAHDPDATDPVSYIVEYNDCTVFHGGDTKPSEAFEDIGERYDIDLAIVAFGAVGNIFGRDHEERTRTRWYCDENQVIEIVNALEADRLLPSHWDMWKGMTADPKALRHHGRSWAYPRTFDIVEIGDRVDLS